MSKPSLPSPHEPFVDKQTGKVSDVWYRYLSQELTQSNALTDVVGGLSTGTTGLTAVAFSSFAIQGDQETSTSNTAVVTPGVQQYHPSAAKAWGKVAIAGTVGTLVASYNVASVLLASGGGPLSVSFSVPFSSSDYSVISAGVNCLSGEISSVQAATSFALVFNTTSPHGAHFACYGDQ